MATDLLFVVTLRLNCDKFSLSALAKKSVATKQVHQSNVCKIKMEQSKWTETEKMIIRSTEGKLYT